MLTNQHVESTAKLLYANAVSETHPRPEWAIAADTYRAMATTVLTFTLAGPSEAQSQERLAAKLCSQVLPSHRWSSGSNRWPEVHFRKLAVAGLAETAQHHTSGSARTERRRRILTEAQARNQHATHCIRYPDGTSATRRRQAGMARARRNRNATTGDLTWRDLLDCRVQEAYAETEPSELADKLADVITVATDWLNQLIGQETLKEKRGETRAR